MTMMVPELFAPMLPIIKSVTREAQSTEAYTDKHNFTKVEHPVLPRHSSSFLGKLPVADVTLAYKKEEVSYKIGGQRTYIHANGRRDQKTRRPEPRSEPPQCPRLTREHWSHSL
jgi:hypothetical protein